MLKSIIVAKTENNVIGRNNALAWHLPNDSKFFKTKTMGHYLIMGRKTFESIEKPLLGRKIIIVTKNQHYQAQGHSVVQSVATAFDIAEQAGEKEVFIAGGGEIYRATLAMTDKLYLTEIKANVEGDTFFPTLNQHDWVEKKRQKHLPDAKHSYAYDFIEWDRRKKT